MPRRHVSELTYSRTKFKIVGHFGGVKGANIGERHNVQSAWGTALHCLELEHLEERA